ncbi:MAG: hypothetical protein GXP48_08615 [Acidobacteria bacterium]|nr:hypothetical protein [Acidobacteriota bacterium]
MSFRRRYWLLLLGFLALHAVLATTLPISGDEAYYWDCSRHVAWSYFDQPPLVIWAIVPFRLILGDTRLAVRAPALLSSLLLGIFLLGLIRRLGGSEREAFWAYIVLHGMPLFFLGAFYTSTDIGMTALWVAAAWAAVALAQGEEKAWWGFAIAIGLGFLAKFPIVLILPALLPVVLTEKGRRQLLTLRPYAAGAVAFALTAPVWIWAARHDWANITFQLEGRHSVHAIGLRYVLEFIGANLLLATPFLAIAMAVAWWRGWRHRDPGWIAALLAAAAPFVAFGFVALRERVGAHWGGPGLIVGVAVLALSTFRWRKALVVSGMVFGLLLSALVVGIAAMPERVCDLHWSYRGSPHHINTSKLAAAVGNREIVRELEGRLRPGELIASESYTTVHLLAFLSRGRLQTRLADINRGKHGLASLYWYTPGQLRGKSFLFVTAKEGLDAPLGRLFASVTEKPPIVIRRGGRVIRTLKIYECTSLLHPEGSFTRLAPDWG